MVRTNCWAGIFLFVSVSLFPQAQGIGSLAYPFDESLLAENHEVRRNLKHILFGTNDEILSAKQRIFEQSLSSRRVQFKVEKTKDAVYLLFINERKSDFRIATQGTWVIKRASADGKFLQAKVFLRDDEESFFRIFPLDALRTKMDVFLYGKELGKTIVLPVPFTDLLTEPLATIVRLTKNSLDWNLFFPNVQPEDYRDVRSMVETVRPLLPKLKDREDGAMDRDGTFVYIETLIRQEGKGGFNCSGFAKWVVDGLYCPLTGSLLAVAPLKTKHETLRGNRWSLKYEDERDPYFGLDWSRNLALSLREAQGVKSQTPEDADVRTVPYFAYVEDVGFPIKQLACLLYLLAVKEPGHVYIGSVNRETGTAPVLRQHIHVAVFFPYFTTDGEFRIAVMERNKETSLPSIIARYPADFVHLVRIRPSDNFRPPQIE